MEEDKRILLEIYDTTLRDGGQTAGVIYTVEGKLEAIRKLDDFGVDYIEIGWPTKKNSVDLEVVRRIHQKDLKYAKLAIFGSTRLIINKGQTEKDEGLECLVNAGKECGAGTVTIFGKAWEDQVRLQLGAIKEENIEAIVDSIKFLKDNQIYNFKELIYDAEHFFDGYKDKNHKGYALETIKSAILAGADKIVLCDTNGKTLHFEIEKITKDVVKFIDEDKEIQDYLSKNGNKKISLGIHCHNDSSVANASTISAVRSGVNHIQGTIIGLGERAGNADLSSIIPSFVLKESLNEEYKLNYMLNQNIWHLSKISNDVSRISGRAIADWHPYVGRLAFAHKGGIHVDALMKGATYNHIDPYRIGNEVKVILADGAGASSALFVLHHKLGFGRLDKRSKKVTQFLDEVLGVCRRGLDISDLPDEQYLIAKKIFHGYEQRIHLDKALLSTAYHNGGSNYHNEVTSMHLIIDDGIVPALGQGTGGNFGVGFDAMQREVEKLGMRAGLTLVKYEPKIPLGHKGADTKIQVNITYCTPSGEYMTTAESHENIVIASLLAGAKALSLAETGYKM